MFSDYLMWLSDVEDKKLFNSNNSVKNTELTALSVLTETDGSERTNVTDRLVDSDSELSFTQNVIQDGQHNSDGSGDGKSTNMQMSNSLEAIVKDRSKSPDERHELRKSITTEVEESESLELLNDHGNGKDSELESKDGVSVVDRMLESRPVEHDSVSLPVSATECSPRSDHAAVMNDISSAVGIADYSGPNTPDLTKVST